MKLAERAPARLVSRPRGHVTPSLVGGHRLGRPVPGAADEDRVGGQGARDVRRRRSDGIASRGRPAGRRARRPGARSRRAAPGRRGDHRRGAEGGAQRDRPRRRRVQPAGAHGNARTAAVDLGVHDEVLPLGEDRARPSRSSSRSRTWSSRRSPSRASSTGSSTASTTTARRGTFPAYGDATVARGMTDRTTERDPHVTDTGSQKLGMRIGLSLVEPPPGPDAFNHLRRPDHRGGRRRVHRRLDGPHLRARRPDGPRRRRPRRAGHRARHGRGPDVPASPGGAGPAGADGAGGARRTPRARHRPVAPGRHRGHVRLLVRQAGPPHARLPRRSCCRCCARAR